MFSFRYTIVLAAVTLALAAPLRLRDGVNVAIPFDPVTGDQCNLNLDANALVLKVSPEIESSPDLSNPFCSPINNENTGGALLVFNNVTVSSAVSVVGFCGSCRLGDIQASPALLKLMAGSNSAGSDPLFGSIQTFF